MAMVLVEGPKEAASMRAARYQVSIPQSFDAWFIKATHPDPNLRLPGAAQAVIELCQCLGLEVPTELRPQRPALKVGALTTVVGPESNPVLALQDPRASYPDHSSPYSAPGSGPVSPRSGSDVAIVAGLQHTPTPKRSRGLLLALGAVALGGVVLLAVVAAVYWSRVAAPPAIAVEEEAATTEQTDVATATSATPGTLPPTASAEPAESPPSSASVEPVGAAPEPTPEPPKPAPAPAPETPRSRPEKPSTAKPRASGAPVETPDKLYSRE
jgi:hypothetical protein